MQSNDTETMVDSIKEGQDNLSLITKGYLTAAFWTNEEEPGLCEMGLYDIEHKQLQGIMEEVQGFLESNEELLTDGIDQCPDLSWEHAGHDLWLTRNGHGCGFWDGDWPEEIGKKLTEATEKMGWSTMYLGDDDKVYFM